MKTLILAMLTLAAAIAPSHACDEMRELREAMTQSQENLQNARRERLENQLAEAQKVSGQMFEKLELLYFPGMMGLIDPSPEGVDAFAKLKAKNLSLLDSAGDLARSGAGNEKLRRQLKYLAELGSQTSVTKDGKTWDPVLTLEQKIRILAETPKPAEDPHE